MKVGVNATVERGIHPVHSFIHNCRTGDNPEVATLIRSA
jgi:hypothetical protein